MPANIGLIDTPSSKADYLSIRTKVENHKYESIGPGLEL